MLISHDRYLLRTLTNLIVEVDAGTATRYEGDLDWYLTEREVRYEHLKAAKENQTTTASSSSGSSTDSARRRRRRRRRRAARR